MFRRWKDWMVVLSQDTSVMFLIRGFDRVEKWEFGAGVVVASCSVVRVGCSVGCCGSEGGIETCWVVDAVDCDSKES